MVQFSDILSGKGGGYSTIIYYPVAQDYYVPVPMGGGGFGYGGGYGGGLGGFGGGLGGLGGGLPNGGLGLALGSVNNQNNMGLFGGMGGQSALGGGK